MIYLLALIGLVAVIVLFWKAFGPTTQAPAGRVVGPDDDPVTFAPLSGYIR